MIITDFSYKRDHWNLLGIHLHDTNLLVGPNAVGKSKSLRAISRVADAISGREFLRSTSFSTKLSLRDGETNYYYAFSILNGIITSEMLKVAEEIVISREGEKAMFYGEEVNPPMTRLLLGSRRDTERYVEIEKLMRFFESVSLFSFSSISPGKKVQDPITIGGFDIAGLFSDLSVDDRKVIIDQLNKLGFKVGDLHPIRAMSSTLLAMKEDGVGSEFVMWAFSTGLIRIVALLTYLFHLSNDNNGGLILIDDLGEGLDYHRSTKLGKFICEYCKQKGIQIILTTNDSFLMNVIDIDNWNILSRRGSIVSAMSRDTDPAIFAEFKLTGLSNYDLFRSDFIERKKN